MHNSSGGACLTNNHVMMTDDRGGENVAPLMSALRNFLDLFAGAEPDAGMMAELQRDLEQWSHRLEAVATPEDRQIFGRRLDLPGRGQTMSPAFAFEMFGGDFASGSVTFGRYFLGGNGAVHGGAIPLLFDDVLGTVANSNGRPRSRTAYLRTDYRRIVPVEVRLTVDVRVVLEEGRKLLLRGELCDGEHLCAEAEALFVTLLPGQP